MAKTIGNLFDYLVYASDILIILLFFVFLQKLKKKRALWILPVYCFLNTVVNITTQYFAGYNLYVLINSFFTFFEFSLFSLFIFSVIKHSKIKKVILSSILLFCIFLLLYLNNTTQKTLDSVPIGIETIFILLFSFYYLFEQMNDTENHFIYTRWHFWMVTGIMLYLAGSFFIYVFANHVERSIIIEYWFLTYVFYTLKNILFAIGIYTFVKPPKTSRPKELYPYLN